MKRPGASFSSLHECILNNSNRSSSYVYGSRKQGSWKDLLKATRTTVGIALLGSGAFFLLLRHISPAKLSWLLQTGSKHQSLSDTEDLLQLTLPGLRNVGNNCFLNAILQALSSSERFVSFLTTYDKDNTLSLFNGLESSCQLLPLMESLSDLLTELSVLGTVSSVSSPRHVMLALKSYKKHFDLSSQQDAAEALAHLVDTLREEQRTFYEGFKTYKDSISHAFASSSKRFCEGIIDCDCGKECNALCSCKIQLHFPMEGTMASLLTCHECGFQFSTQFQSFHDVPLSPPQMPDGNIADACSLEACLQRYTATEQITSVRCSRCSHTLSLELQKGRHCVNKMSLKKIEECTYNDNCCCEDSVKQKGGSWRNTYVNASKQLRLGRCPEVICFQVQRAIISRYGDLVKWTGHVSFPLILDLFPYTISAQGHSENKFDFPGRTPIKLMDHSDILQKLLWQRRAFEMVSKSDSQLNKVSLSNDEATSDDTHMSTCSGSDDLTSDSSSESTTAQSGDELVDKCKANPEQVYVEPCTAIREVDSKFMDGFVNAKFENIGDSTSFESCLGRRQNHYPFMLDTSMPILGTSAIGVDSGPKSRCSPVKLLRNDSHNTQKWLYELISVVVHHGSARNGHYTVYRRAKLKNADSVHIDHDSETETSDVLVETTANKSGVVDKSFGKSYDNILDDSGALVQEQASETTKDSRFSTGSPSKTGENLQKSDNETVLWFRVSDSHVDVVTEQEVLMAQASLLFYERCNDM